MAPPAGGVGAPLLACPRPARPGVMAPHPDPALRLDHGAAVRLLLWWVAGGLALVQLLLHAAR